MIANHYRATWGNLDHYKESILKFCIMQIDSNDNNSNFMINDLG